MAIFARSPYILTINEASQTATQIQIFLWNGNSTSMPASPAYTLSKQIPSSTAPSTYYDLSPYIREFINHNALQNITTTSAANPSAQWCWVGVKTYKKTTGAFVQFGSTLTYRAYEGYGNYTDGANPNLFRVHLDQGTYNYYLDGTGSYGHLTIENISGDTIRYTNLVTGATNTSSLGALNVLDYPRVFSSNLSAGNKVEIINGGSTVWTATFQPKGECKYTPVRCDFVNKYGAWQTEWFFKASSKSISVENTEYNLMPATYPSYDVLEGQRKVFNTNGKEKVKVNTDWVNESYSEVNKKINYNQKK